jgi:DNA gyrase subunit B
MSANKKESENTKKPGYSAKDISVLEGLEPVRKRPGMYIGSTGTQGLHHLVWEVFDNSRDEAMAGEADKIELVLLPGNRIRVADNGRGIPVDKHPKTKVSALETIMTVLHAGGKFGDGGYQVSGGLHGVGASVVNALSVYMRAEVHKEGSKYFQEYSIGKKKADVKKIGSSDYRGTIITFEPDIEIFKEIKFNLDTIVTRIRQQAYLVKGMRVTVVDARDVAVEKDTDSVFWFRDLNIEAPSKTFYFEGGLESMVAFFNQDQKPVHSTIFYVEKQYENVGIEIALQYVDDISSRVNGFANTIFTPGGGMHITGFKTALTRTVNNYVKTNKLVPEKEGTFDGTDVLEGLTAVVSVKLPEIQFEGQTKDKLGSVEARGAVESVFAESFSSFLEEHPDEARSIIKKSLLALRARKAAKAAKDSVLRKGALEGMTLPGKLADCQTRSSDEAELFIVEGDSAGGSTKMGRDRRTQAVLPLKGKILNVERARLDKMLASKEVKALVIALGTSIGDTFDIEKARYKKIIIATDADVDGAHIQTLLLTLFYRHFKELIDAGYLYIAQPPLYKIVKGKDVRYAYNDDQKQDIVKEFGGEVEDSDDVVVEGDAEEIEKKTGGKIKIQRYKGLGEMNPEELRETTLDKDKRVLKQVTVDDAQETDKIFDILMGATVPPRKAFIQNNAKNADVDL